MLTSVHPLIGQRLWLPDSSNSISLQYLKPNFKGQSIFSTFSALYMLSGKFRISKNIHDKTTMSIDVPFATAKIENGFFQGTESMLGNILVDFEHNKRNQKWSYIAGLALPTAGTNKTIAQTIGVGGDPNRFETVVTDVFYMYAGTKFVTKLDDKLSVKIRGALNLFIDDGEVLNSNQLFFDYSVLAAYSSSKLLFNFGISARWLVNPDDTFNDDSQRTTTVFGGSLMVNTNRPLKPGVSIRLPVSDDLNDFIDSVLGISLTYQL